MSRIVERWNPSAIGILVAVSYMILCRQYRAPDTAKDLLAAAVSIGAIAVGFLANMKAVLFTIDKKRIIQQLRDAGEYNSIVDYLLWAIAASSFLAIVSAVGIVIDFKSRAMLYPVSVAVWLFAATTALLSYWRVITVFTRILRSTS